jgi:hypothetical protein
MTDRELLELAARAAGYAISWVDSTAIDGLIGFRVMKTHATSAPWNPLTDDGDALRLAMKLQMEVRCMGPRSYATIPCVTHIADEFNLHDNDAATRRAIVRAAAEQWKNTA